MLLSKIEFGVIYAWHPLQLEIRCSWAPTKPPRGQTLHPVRNPRFAYFRTQPLENLSAAVKLPIRKRSLGNPTLGTHLGQRILAMRAGCTKPPRGQTLRPPRPKVPSVFTR